jgi:hypothetical protein
MHAREAQLLLVTDSRLFFDRSKLGLYRTNEKGAQEKIKKTWPPIQHFNQMTRVVSPVWTL